MRVAATISVKTCGGDRPDRKKLEEAAKLLAQNGFDIVRIGRIGVSVNAEQRNFSQVLGVDARPDTAMATQAKPSQPELRELIGQVEVAPKAQLY
jgi:hypothetical protein